MRTIGRRAGEGGGRKREIAAVLCVFARKREMAAVLCVFVRKPRALSSTWVSNREPCQAVRTPGLGGKRQPEDSLAQNCAWTRKDGRGSKRSAFGKRHVCDDDDYHNGRSSGE
jgi:hypothetical protein